MSETNKRDVAVMSRKNFLRGVGALGAAAISAKFGLLSGAAWAQEKPPEGEYGGAMAFNLTGDPTSFDPISGTSSVTMCIIAPCYNGLARFDPQDPENIIPDLATSWDISEDGKTYTFHLIQNVKFHDGMPMTSADAKYTFDVMRDPPSGTISARQSVLTLIDSIDTPDDHTVVFNLNRPSPSFLATMASCWMLVLPKHILEVKGSMKEDIVGTGPFKLLQYTQGVSYELVKNPDYHVPGRPYLDSVTGFVIPDSGTTWNYLQNGQLTLFYSIQGQDAGAFKTGGDVVVLEAPSTSFIGTVFNLNVAPFDNILVRQALSIGVDRTAALQVTYNGQGEFGGITVPGKWALPESELAKIPGYGPDGSANIEEAKRLLAEAGYPDGFEVTVLVRKNPLFEPVGVFLKDQWAKLGVIATLNVQENATYAEARASGDFAVTASGGSYALSDPDSVFGDETLCGQANSNMCPTELGELFAAQSAEMDETKRLALVNELETGLLKQYGVYVMYWRKRFMGQSTRLQDFKLHGNMDQNMRLEDVWLTP